VLAIIVRVCITRGDTSEMVERGSGDNGKLAMVSDMQSSTSAEMMGMSTGINLHGRV